MRNHSKSLQNDKVLFWLKLTYLETQNTEIREALPYQKRIFLSLFITKDFIEQRLS